MRTIMDLDFAFCLHCYLLGCQTLSPVPCGLCHVGQVLLCKTGLDYVTLQLSTLWTSFILLCNIISTYHFIIHELILVFFLSCLSCSTSIEIPEAQGFLHLIWWTYTPTDIVALKMELGNNIWVCDLHSKGLFFGYRHIMKYLGTKSSPLPDRIFDQFGYSLDSPVLSESSFFLMMDLLAYPRRHRTGNKNTCIANLDATHTQLCKEQGRQTVRAASSWEWIFWEQEAWETEKTFYRLQDSALKCLSSHGSTTSIPGLLSHSSIALILLYSLSNAHVAWSSCFPLSPIWPCKLGSFEMAWLPLPWRSFLERESPSMRSQQQLQWKVSLPVGGSANCPWKLVQFIDLHKEVLE